MPRTPTPNHVSPELQRRHYYAVAEAFERANSTMPEDTRITMAMFVQKLAAELARYNDNFQKERFIDACGYSAADGAPWRATRRSRR